VYHHARDDRIECSVDVREVAPVTGDHVDAVFDPLDHRVVERRAGNVPGLIDLAPEIDADSKTVGDAPSSFGEEQPAAAPEVEDVVVGAQARNVDDPHALTQLPHAARRDHHQRNDRECDAHQERDDHDDQHARQRPQEHDDERAQRQVRQVAHDPRRVHPVLTARPEIDP
jgi:hypothetical protein